MGLALGSVMPVPVELAVHSSGSQIIGCAHSQQAFRLGWVTPPGLGIKLALTVGFWLEIVAMLCGV